MSNDNPYPKTTFEGATTERVKSITIHNPDGQPYHATIEWQYKVETPIATVYPFMKKVNIVFDETNELHQEVLIAIEKLIITTKGE